MPETRLGRDGSWPLQWVGPPAGLRRVLSSLGASGSSARTHLVKTYHNSEEPLQTTGLKDKAAQAHTGDPPGSARSWEHTTAGH